MRAIAISTFLALPLMAACVQTPSPVTRPLPDGEASCGAKSLQYLVGRDNSALSAMTFINTTRFLKPDTVVTQDYRPDRLNFLYNDQDIIVRIYCG